MPRAKRIEPTAPMTATEAMLRAEEAAGWPIARGHPTDQSGYYACNYARYLAKDKPQFDGIQAWITAGRPAE